MNQYIYFTVDPSIDDEVWGLMENLNRIPQVYPGWKARVITLGPAVETIKDVVSMQGAELHDHPATHAVQTPSLVSFLYACQIAPNHRFLIRSPYCRVGRREASAVQQWMNSQAQFHVIRDDAVEHDTQIVPHLWGGIFARVNMLSRTLTQSVDAFFKGRSREILDPTRLAERTLAEIVWPRAKHWGVMRHDESPRSFDFAGLPFPPHEPDDQPRCGLVYVFEEPEERKSDATEKGQEPSDGVGQHSGAEECREASGSGGSDCVEQGRQEAEKEPEVAIDTGFHLV